MATIFDTVPATTKLDGLINAALDIASRDAALRRKLIDAIHADDDGTALQAACDLIGVRPGPSISALIHAEK
jgi:hypothetical protein